MNHPLPPQLRLHRLGDSDQASLMIASVPWPRADVRPISLNGKPTANIPLGQWHGTAPGVRHPRRMLLIADSGNDSPEHIAVTEGNPVPTSGGPPTATYEVFQRIVDRSHITERALLRLTWGGRSIGLAMGLKHAGEAHWWEACRLIVREQTPHYVAVEMGGAIPRIITGMQEIIDTPGYKNPFLHNHNWLNGHIYARLHANGVCEIFAHHINGKNFDEGKHLEDVVPVIAIHQPGHAGDAPTKRSPINEATGILKVDDATFDLAEVARLSSPEHPGHIERQGDWLIITPYPGVHLFGGVCPKEITGDPFLFRPEQKIFPRGMARTLRFSLSLNPDRYSSTARYLAPGWWYGLCEELTPAPLLPVSNEYDHVLEGGREYSRNGILKLGFEDGNLPRHGSAQGDRNDHSRYEPSWEGEIPYAMFLDAYRTGDEEDYNNAMRSAWFFTDVVIDHAAKLARMHGFPPNAFAPPMNRLQGTIAAFLETGDPYLFDTAEAAVEAAYRLEMNSWPRMSVGRDACFVRSAILLYRYFNSEHFLRIARESAMHVVHAQRPNGSFGDQGGGTGIHQWSAYITKPWMGLLSTACVIDFLELFPNEPAMFECVKKFGDWLLRERVVRNNVRTWAYQHDTNGDREFYDMYRKGMTTLPSPQQWHQENLARLLTFCTQRTGDPAYFDAWAESHEGWVKAGRTYSGDHSVSAALQYIPWLQANLWQARWENGKLVTKPADYGPRTPRAATISTPSGEVKATH